MNPFKNIFPIFLITGLSVFGQTSNPWSLQECIRFAQEHNLEQYQYQLNEKSAKVSANQAKMNMLPYITASSNAGISYGRSVDPNSNDLINTSFFKSSFGINAGMTLFQGFMLQNRAGYAKYQRDGQKWTRINHADNLSFDVMIAYYDLIYNEGLTKIIKEQLDLSNYNVKRIEKQIETGLKSKSDLAQIQASREKELLNLIEATNKTETCRLKLAQYLNLPSDEIIAVEEQPEDSLFAIEEKLNSDSLYEEYVTYSSYVKIAEAKYNASSKQLAIARGNYAPTLSLNASIGSAYSETNMDTYGKVVPFNDQVSNNLGEYVGAAISIPIFSKNQARSTVRLAKLEKEQAKTELDYYRQTTYYEVMNNTRELESLNQQFLQTLKQYEAEDLAFKLAQRKYDEGILNVIDLLTVKNRLAESKVTCLSAQLQLKVKQRVIEFYKGNRFWEIN